MPTTKAQVLVPGLAIQDADPSADARANTSPPSRVRALAREAAGNQKTEPDGPN